ncbi:MAG: metallophosphoesterase [Turicibacter sp.]|nr:metallophosphoesterase [Turicibacter sp.]
MEIIIASDNHYNQKVLELIHGRHHQDADLFLHLGDSQLPYDSPLMKDFIKVAGNCDYDRNYPSHQVQDLPGLDKIFMAHGHEHGVKETTKRLEAAAKDVGATIACYGHSHCVDVYREDGGLIVINPGSTFLPRNTRERTYATLTIGPDDYQVKVLQVETGKVLLQKTFEKGA